MGWEGSPGPHTNLGSWNINQGENSVLRVTGRERGPRALVRTLMGWRAPHPKYGNLSRFSYPGAELAWSSLTWSSYFCFLPDPIHWANHVQANLPKRALCSITLILKKPSLGLLSLGALALPSTPSPTDPRPGLPPPPRPQGPCAVYLTGCVGPLPITRHACSSHHCPACFPTLP